MRRFNDKLILCFILFCVNSVLSQDKKLTAGPNTIEDSLVKSRPVGLNFTVTTEDVILRSPPEIQKPNVVCPGPSAPRPFFSLRCSTHEDCGFLGNGILCCNTRCIKGVPPPEPEPIHSPGWFGLVDRVCPREPIPEFLEIRQCVTDADCTPRICCPETLLNGSVVGFCRTAEAKFDRVPVMKRFMEPFRAIMSYMQCTPPPPPVLDLFPKPCKSPLDCFPNLCCQEKGKRYCRPPKRSLLALVAGVSQRIIPTRTARRFIERITS